MSIRNFQLLIMKLANENFLCRTCVRRRRQILGERLLKCTSKPIIQEQKRRMDFIAVVYLRDEVDGVLIRPLLIANIIRTIW